MGTPGHQFWCLELASVSFETSADVAIRIAQAQDAPAIASMSRDYIEHGLGWGWRQGRVARSIADPEVNVAAG
jgi:hypothetical protein